MVAFYNILLKSSNNHCLITTFAPFKNKLNKMAQLKQIKSALISVYYKDGLDALALKLKALGVTIYSTGGTQQFLEDLNIPVTAVEDITKFPSIFGGRVKTLHPAVFGGILNRRDNPSDQKEKAEHQIPDIDLVIVDLYPFEQTVAEKASLEDTIEKIDIGGISLIRAAAKNYNDTVILSSKKQYSELLDILNTKNGATDIEDRQAFAKAAFATSSHYDAAIYSYFAGDLPHDYFKASIEESKALRYGENPHQRGVFYGPMQDMFDILSGKELSYNNLLDVDAAVNLMNDFEAPTFAILKHNNACGVASRTNILDAWKDALAGDPVSAFGGVLIANRTIDKATAEAMHSLFFEVLIAPDFDADALEVLKAKPNRILLKQKSNVLPKYQFRTLLNGVLWQDKDTKVEDIATFQYATNTQPTEAEKIDLIFANKLVKHTKSNTIVFAKNGQLLASGTGQTSRVDALKQAIVKANAFGFDLKGAVMASDAFFPFPDCVQIADEVGITAVIQPGGSIKDKDSIAYCNEHGLAMVMTGTRHFKH
jgi:phosphoribosylaminoimidazolecarboxamide formyltransferase / IMP cyclohydrolase